jgi:hypothetical protein
MGYVPQPAEVPRVDMSREGGAAMKRGGSTLMLVGLIAATDLFAYTPVALQQSSYAQPAPSGVFIPRNNDLTKKYQKRFVHITKRYRLNAENSVSSNRFCSRNSRTRRR